MKKITKKTKLTLIIFVFCLCLLCNSCGHKDNKTPDVKQDETPNNQNEYTPSDYEYMEMSDRTISINAYIGKTDSSTLTIPTYINEKKVTAISDYAFANNLYGNNTIKTIIIPATIKSIGKCAFYNSDSIEKIEFEESSELTTIGEYAFSMMENLHTIQIPNKVNLIEQNAFLYSGITKINTGNNDSYKWEDGFLLDQNVYDKTKRIAIYANPTMKEIVVPDNVDQLNSELFKNNQNIISIDLNNITHIGVECFANSSLEQVIGGTNVTGSDKNAFLGTKWLNDQNTEYVKIGNVLLEYVGNKTIEVIGENAFTNCLNLEYILLTPSRPPIINGTIINDDVNIYVNIGDYKYYQSSIYYQNIKSQISTKSFKITFNDIDGNYLGEKEEIYGSTFDNYILDEIYGMDFLYWEDEEGNKYYINHIIDAYEDIILTPIYEKTKYIIKLVYNDSESEIEVTYQNTINIETPIKNGYEFIGWYDSPEGGNQIINESGTVVWNRTNEVEILYAQYSLIIYEISYINNGGEFLNNDNRLSFSIEDPITKNEISEIRKFGFVFDYWKVNIDNEEFVSTSNYYSDIVLEAIWLGEEKDYSNYATATIETEYIIITMPTSNTSKQHYFTITSKVKYVTFVGYDKKFTDMKIVISNRTNDLVLGFDSISFSPAKATNSYGTKAVHAIGQFTLYVTYKGICNITGGDGMDGSPMTNTFVQAKNNEDGIDGFTGVSGLGGGEGISGYKINISEYDENSFLVVTGGNGGEGGRGGNAQQGSNGVNGPSGSFLKPKKGDDGADGGKGGTGGNGGDGAYAIYVAGSTYLTVTSTAKFELYGGEGGNGGPGGYGGDGGNGASDTSSNAFTGVGKPGNGGNGGAGGDGGNGGDGSNATNASNVKGYFGFGGTGGYGNRGGNGGTGGSAGSYGSNGKNGSDGKNGTSGSVGTNGKSGVNTEGSSLSINNVSYVYRKDFFATCIK